MNMGDTLNGHIRGIKVKQLCKAVCYKMYGRPPHGGVD